ncbi:histone acetyltransferases subunit 3-domain-containing protein [Sporodiniella umbellata]|nr:histone acetyltransferases subunit 3-domain-containing protein [Sporodiniella umbellata]
MNTDFTRQYKLPKPVSSKTSSLIKIAQQQPLVIPDAQELQTIKADLEILLPLSETRALDLKKGLHNLHGNLKLYEEDKTRIKQEPDDFTDTVSFPPKNEQQSRQAALETIRRRRRKEELEEGARHSEPPQMKLKQHEARGYESLSPPSDYVKKKKQGIHARAQDEADFIRVKAKDQVPITTFWTTMEPFFRTLTEEDRTFLMERADTSKALWVPPLGEHYVDQWSREDALLQTKLTRPSRPLEPVKLRYLKEPITEDHLLSDDLTSGTLTERLLSSLVAEHHLSKQPDESEPEEPEWEEWEDEEDASFSPLDFEERLKRELRYAGLLTEDDADWNAREDDEICAELRALGRDYKEQVDTNDFRKKKLLEIVDNQLQFEQYRHVLDTLDSQVEQGYIKRFRNQKSKKRKVPTGQRSTLSENAVYVMEKRKAWIDALGAIFESKNQIMPSSSIYSSESATFSREETD